MLPYLLAIAGGYLIGSSAKKFEEGGETREDVLITKDKIEVSGLNAYRSSKKSGKFYNIFAKRKINNNQYEYWWIRFARKDGINDLGYIDYRITTQVGDEDEYESEEKRISLSELPQSLIDIYNNPNIQYEDGGKINSIRVDEKLKDLGFEYNKFSNRYGKRIDENDYITAFYDKNKKLYKIRGIHKYKTPLGDNSMGIEYDFNNENEFYNKISEYLNKQTK